MVDVPGFDNTETPAHGYPPLLLPNGLLSSGG